MGATKNYQIEQDEKEKERDDKEAREHGFEDYATWMAFEKALAKDD